MKTFILFLSLFASLSSFAGDMYLSCGFGEEEHWENFTDSILDDNRKGMVTLKNNTKTYVVTFDGMFYRYIKSNSNRGGFEERTVMPTDMSSRKVSAIVDDVWCHIND
jgi:hypothetical protein